MLAIAAGPAMAQDTGGAQAGNPPGLELIDESEQPTITIRRPDATSEITERKEHGVIKEIKVQAGGSTYYLLPNNPLGSAFQDAGSRVVRPALWRVHEFDMAGQRPEDPRPDGEDGAEFSADAPAPPSVLQ